MVAKRRPRLSGLGVAAPFWSRGARETPTIRCGTPARGGPRDLRTYLDAVHRAGIHERRPLGAPCSDTSYYMVRDIAYRRALPIQQPARVLQVPRRYAPRYFRTAADGGHQSRHLVLQGGRTTPMDRPPDLDCFSPCPWQDNRTQLAGARRTPDD